MSDRDTFYEMLREAQGAGVHSLEVRHRCSGNPSQRARELVARGIEVSKQREFRGGRNGARYFLTEYAPLLAEPVHPDRTGGGVDPAPSSSRDVASGADDTRHARTVGRPAGAAPLGRRRSPAGVPPSLALVGGVRRMVVLRDYTRPESGWREVPEDEALVGWPKRKAAA